MAQVTAAMVKALREGTGAGMMTCKKALVESDGNMEKAELAIAKAGLKKAAKSESRTAAEGIIIAAVEGKNAILLEVNSETDFVGRDESFKVFAEKVASIAVSKGIDNLEALKNETYGSEGTVEQARQTLVQRIGENIQIRRLALLTSEKGQLGYYVHMGRIGVVVSSTSSDETLSKDLSMQIAACKPEYLSPEQVPEDRIAKEKEIFVSQAQASGKPAEIIEKMVQGKLKKALNAICLTGQAYIKDQDKLIEQLLKEKAATVESYLRFELGEGIEKKQGPSFAEEVAAQVGGSK